MDMTGKCECCDCPGDANDVLNIISAKAEKAIYRFLAHPNDAKLSLPFEMRKHIRLVSGFCPDAATTTRALALHCLTTNRGNAICLYHHKLNKAGRVCDEGQQLKGTEKSSKQPGQKVDKQPGKKEDEQPGKKAEEKPSKKEDEQPGKQAGDTGKANSKFQVTGVPYMRRIADRGQPPLAMPPGFLHCGCAEDDALLDFWWFKTGKITSPFNGVTEGWLTDLLEPCPRAFMANIFRQISGLSIDNLYTEDSDCKTLTPEYQLNAQIAVLQAKADILKKAREEAEAVAKVTSLLD
jgi:hypothetical protein